VGVPSTPIDPAIAGRMDRPESGRAIMMMGADAPIPPMSEECRRPRRDAPAADRGETALTRAEGLTMRPSDSEQREEGVKSLMMESRFRTLTMGLNPMIWILKKV